MESVLSRYRNLIVLVVVLFAQVMGLAVQVKRTNDSEPTRLIRVWVVDTVTPLERMLVGAQTATSAVWHNYFYLRGVRAENRALKQEIERMRLEQVRMSQDADQARRLQSLLGFKEQFISQTVAAQVIGSSGSEQSRAVYIDKGETASIKPDMAVITTDGIVGKVLHVYRSTSLVLLINDQSSGVGAILETSRLQGILRGTPAGEIALEKVMSDETVPVGELVLTSGGDRIFPKGLPVGRVTKVSPGSDLFLNIRVKPAISLSRLEEVLVVTKIDERQAQSDRSATARAADILAERLPSVPPKPESALGGTAASSSPGSAAKPTVDTTKPKVSPFTSGANGNAPSARKPVTPASSSATNVSKTAAGAAGAKTPSKPTKPTTEPKPQPAAPDPPQ